MKYKFILLFIPLLLHSCIEIIDDLTIHMDGSGTFKYTINLSSSKIKVNSILALDSLNGQKVPSIGEINQKILEFENLLKKQPGLSEIKVDFNSSDYILKFSLNFDQLSSFQDGLKKTMIELGNPKNKMAFEGVWATWDGKSLGRKIPEGMHKKFLEFESSDIQLLKSGTYTCISRFDKTIEKNSNITAKINPNRTATMLRVNTYDLRLNKKLLDNTTLLNSN